MDFMEQLGSELNDALRSGDEVRKRTLRMLIAELKNAEIEHRGELDEAAVQAVLKRQVRQRQDSIEQYTKGGRADLVAAEEEELAIIEGYLPEQMSPDEIEAAAERVIESVEATGPSDMGRVMGPLMNEIGAKADGRVVSTTVQRLLSR